MSTAHTQSKPRSGVLGFVMSALVIGIGIAIAWFVLKMVLGFAVGIVALGIKIAIIILAIMVLLAVFGWIRVHLFKR